MRNKQSGFTLLEILIAIAILGIIMAMNSTLLQEMIRGTRQQGSIVTSQFETALGLEVFRNDLGNAGYGLPDAFLANPASTVYSEPYWYMFRELVNDGSNPAAVAPLMIARILREQLCTVTMSACRCKRISCKFRLSCHKITGCRHE